MKFRSVYKTQFSFHIGLEPVYTSALPYALQWFHFLLCIHCAFCATPQMNGRLLELIMRLHFELILDTAFNSTVYTMSDKFHPSFKEFSFENAKTV